MVVYGRTFLNSLVSVGSVAGLAACIVAAGGSGCSSNSSNNTPAGADSGNGTDANAEVDTGVLSEGGSSPGEGGSLPGDGATDASADAGIVVTSPDFADGQPIPNLYTCAGADTSPEIDWTAGSARALSYALVVSDLTATANIHWVVWDIPTTTHSLPAMLPTDPVLTTPVSAKQVDLRTNPDAGTTMNGFFGPCPRGATHSYEFAVHAIDVATLPGVTTTSRSADVKIAVLAHSLAEGVLTGTSNAAPPDGGSPADAGDQ